MIGGWVWDKSLSDKLGMTADHLQRGEHADAMFGVTIPLLGLSLPGRNLTDDERDRIEQWIREHYDDFITNVANGRDMSKKEVDEIAQGRFYSGADGKKIGLVDDIGGLMMAMDFALADAGLEQDDDIEIVEIAKSRGLMELLPLQTSLDKIQNDPVVRYLHLLSDNPYRPLDMMPPGSYPDLQK